MHRAPLRGVLVATLVALIATLLPLAAAADPDATTDDKSVAKPTGWFVVTNATLETVSSRINDYQARLTDIELHSSGRYTATMVRNSGAYAVPGWWWYVGLTGSQVSSKLSEHSARLIDIEPYATSEGTRFIVVMVANSGTTARAWTWLYGASQSQVDSHVADSGHRLIDLEQYSEGGTTKFAVIAVANTGRDGKAWQYWYGQTLSDVASRINAFGGRLTNLERRSDGRYNIILVKNAGTDAFAWWWYPSLSSLGAATKLAAQFGARIVDVETYLVLTRSGPVRRYAVVLIDNANGQTRRVRSLFSETFTDSSGHPIGSFGAYLKPVGKGAKVSLNSSAVLDPASSLKALHHLHALRRVQSGADTLSESFTYYNYPTPPNGAKAKDECPDPVDETSANRKSTSLGNALEWMMVNSDNRTTRGVVLRAGGYAPLNQTASIAGMSRTVLRQDIGCGYRDGIRNSTSLVDLAKLYEGVTNGSLLSGSARTAFWSKMIDGNMDGTSWEAIVRDEAEKLGKTGVVQTFLNKTHYWVKGGSYGICLNTSGDCQRGITRSEAGRLRLPFKKSNGTIAHRHYVFGAFIYDVPVSCWDCSEDAAYATAYGKVAREVARLEIRAALKTW